MGAYLSEPITDKCSTDEVGERVICGASSMQGWRVTQEDAHNCNLDYDTNTSFFAVYDGHGGHEVATYSAQHLPQYLKICEAYKKGDYAQALKDAFLEFDTMLTTPEVIAELKKIANNKDVSQNSGSDDEEENVNNLYEEAEMPLEQVMAKYQSDILHNKRKTKEDGKLPFVRAHRSCTSGASSSGLGMGTSWVNCSAKNVKKPGNGNTDCDENTEIKKNEDECSSLCSEAQCSSISSQHCVKAEPEEISSQHCVKAEPEEISSQHCVKAEPEETSCSSRNNGDTNLCATTESEKCNEIVSSSSDNTKLQSLKETADTSHCGNLSDNKDTGNVKQEVNGKTGQEKNKSKKGMPGSSKAHENGEVIEKERKGKANSKGSIDDNRCAAPLGRRSASALYHSLLGNQDSSESDSDDGDESFQGTENSTDDDDDVDDDDDDEDEDDDDVEEEDEDDDDDDDDDEDDDDSMLDDEDDFTMKMTEEPGSDSGCTAVVALLKGQELYVANAGDSRCVVCRSGKAIEMSLDHKPEDEIEMARIVKAGGKVTADGRVNGGLNLSRALGDHAYKQTEGLPAQEQMITALPDVRTLMIDPTEDEFMILACDGIWNFMSSQEVVDFIRPHIQKGQTKLSKICEELFDHCLAPDTHGDGTGCDNMTAVLVQFQPELVNTCDNISLKRSASPSSESNSETTKRSRLEENELPTSV